MRRRDLLSIVGLSLTFAGCTSDGESVPIEKPSQVGASGRKTADDSTPTVTESPTESSTLADSGEPDVTITEGSFGVADFGYTEYPYYEVEIINEGDAPSGIVELVVDWFDSNGQYVDDTTEELVSLKPGETWSARSYNILNDEEVVSAEASGSYGLEPPEWPDGLNVASSRLLAGEENLKVRATVNNSTGQTVDYVAFYGKLYDAEGTVLGQVWTNEFDLGNGSSWRTESEWDDVARSRLVESHEVLLEGDIY